MSSEPSPEVMAVLVDMTAAIVSLKAQVEALEPRADKESSMPIQLTEHDLRRMFPRARSDYIQALISGAGVLREYGILDNSQRWCAFIANVGQETGGLTIVRENMNYTAKNLLAVWPSRYPNTIAGRSLAASHAKKGGRFIANYNYGFRLGNRGRDTDDGWNYRGALLLQHTGRSMALWLQERTGQPWADKPEMFDDVSLCVEPACLVWTSQDLGNLNDWADRGNYRACCNGINRGNPKSAYNPIGWDQRQEWHRKALAIWSDEAQVAEDPAILRAGMPYLEIVRHYQQRLHDLGYHMVGVIDGKFGDNTADAVMSFQRVNNLTIDGIIGPQTRAALDSDEALPKPIAEDRIAATAKDLATAGSTTVVQAQTGQNVSAVLGGVSALGALKWAGDQVQTVRDVVEPVSGHVTWLFAYWPVGLAVTAYLLYANFGGIIASRLRDHVTGRHTGS